MEAWSTEVNAEWQGWDGIEIRNVTTLDAQCQNRNRHTARQCEIYDGWFFSGAASGCARSMDEGNDSHVQGRQEV